MKLNDMQLILLSTASQREDGHFFPLAESLAAEADAASKGIAALIKRGFAVEQETAQVAQALRTDEDRRVGVVITEAGLKAIQVGEAEVAEVAPEQSPQSNAGKAGKRQSAKKQAAAPVATTTGVRAGTKQAALVALLSGPNGASIDEIVAATGWLPHTSRAALTGLKKRGYAITPEKVDGVSRYRVTGNPE